ncbi:MAG: hypothetical protein SFW62_00655 [Alphaproteobacteria bacterium]|nr:hypothetical protein [Alphaproteobacteria bacterium]
MTSDKKIEIASYILAGFTLYLILKLGLLAALLAGLFVYRVVELGARGLSHIGILPKIGRIILLLLIAVVVVVGISYGVIGIVSHLTKGPESLSVLMSKMADVTDTARTHLPTGFQDYLPFNITEWQEAASDWLRGNARQVSILGRDVGLFLTHLVVGMIIGGLIALTAGGRVKRRPLAQALNSRALHLDRAFLRIVFSQIRISALNTFLTGIFLIIVMPAIGSPLPLIKTLITVTFLAGLLPIIGNLISNTAITLWRSASRPWRRRLRSAFSC